MVFYFGPRMNKQTNADTSHMSHAEIDKHGLHGSKRPPGKSPGGTLHQRGGSLKQVRNYPALLGGVVVVVAIGTVAYYRSIHPEPKGQSGSHSPKLQKAEETKKAATQS